MWNHENICVVEQKLKNIASRVQDRGVRRQYLVEKRIRSNAAGGGKAGMIERVGDANAHPCRGVTYFIKRSRYTDVGDIVEMGRTCTCVRWRKEGGQTGRNICFPSQYSVEERLQPINPRGNELFSPISLTGMLARPLPRNFRSVSLLPPSFVSYSRKSIFLF